MGAIVEQKVRISEYGSLGGEPEVPEGPWFKRLSGMIVGGEGELVKTFLLPGQSPKGIRLP